MSKHRIKRGLDLPLAGAPKQRVFDAPQPTAVAVVAADYVGMKPTMRVRVGDAVSTGDTLFEHKKLPGIRFTSPASGTVSAIERGQKRALVSVVVRVDPGAGAHRAFASFTGKHPSSLAPEDVRELLLESGLWTAIRARPFGGLADPATRPHSIFVTAMDTNPLAPNSEVLLEGHEEDFERGLHTLSRLSEGPVHICRATDTNIPVPTTEPFEDHQFSGPHPSGTVGVHIHLLDPVHQDKLVWYVGLQDVTAIGRLFATGELSSERIVALCGPSVRDPRLLRTRLGAATADLVRGELVEGQHRVVSGSVLSDRRAEGATEGFLGRYHQQISVLGEGDQRELLGWLSPGRELFSTSRTFLSKLLPQKKFAMTTTTHGSDRAIVSIGLYERVMPLDIEPSFLLKAVVSGDIDRAAELGALELEEEDLALCTFVCPSKVDYGPHLRAVLDELEAEG